MDSYLFFQTKLANLPKCMGLDDEVKKGYHPYLFTDINYVGAIVNWKFFDLSSMNKKIREKFDK